MGNCLGLLAAIIPKRSWMKELLPFKTHLGLFGHSETIIFKDTLQSITFDENQLLIIKFNHNYEIWLEGQPKKAK